MVLRLASDEVREVRKALSGAYRRVLSELGRVEAHLTREQGVELCRRKWKLETLLRQLDHSEEPPPVLELVPLEQRGAWRREAA